MKINFRKYLVFSIIISGSLVVFSYYAQAQTASVPLPPAGDSYYIDFDSRVVSVISANLDGDDILDWVGKTTPHFAGTTKLEARRLNGSYLWAFDTKMTEYQTFDHWFMGRGDDYDYGDGHLAWDLDQDGIDEVFVSYWEDNTGKLVGLNGETGQIKWKINYPYGWGDVGSPRSYPPMMGDHFMAIGYLDGPNGKPSLLVEYGVYTGGAVWAFDWDPETNNLTHRWTYQSPTTGMGTAGHFITTFDLNSDGREEIIMGGTLLNPDGTITTQGKAWFYHNSFSGGRQAVQVNNADKYSPNGMGNVNFVNNIMSTGVNWQGNSGGLFAYNWVAGTNQRTGTGVYSNGTTLMWDTPELHNFDIPSAYRAGTDKPAEDSACDMADSVEPYSCGSNLSAFPGVSSFTMFGGGFDMGAVEVGSNPIDTTPPAPPSGVSVQ